MELFADEADDGCSSLYPLTTTQMICWFFFERGLVVF